MSNTLKLLLACILVVACVAESDVVVLTDDNFDQLTADGDWLLEFYAPWCGHCKNLAPAYEELATKMKGKFNIAKIDCTVQKGLQSRFGIRGFPTIKFATEGKLYDYEGQRNVNSFVSFLEGGFQSAKGAAVPKAQAPPAAGDAAPKNSPSNVVILTNQNFEELTNKGVWLLDFYAPWCGHCKRLAPIYDELSTDLKGVVHLGKIDCTTEKAICSQYNIEGYPTIYYKRDNTIREYSSGRTKDAFKKFVESGWNNEEPRPVPAPLSGWKLYAQSIMDAIENGISFNMWVVLGACILVGVLLGVCVVAMTPAAPAAKKTVHYTAPASSEANGEIVAEAEIVSKND